MNASRATSAEVREALKKHFRRVISERGPAAKRAAEILARLEMSAEEDEKREQLERRRLACAAAEIYRRELAAGNPLFLIDYANRVLGEPADVVDVTTTPKTGRHR